MCKKELFENKAVAYHEYLQQAFMAKRVYRIFIFISDNLTIKNIDSTLDPLSKTRNRRKSSTNFVSTWDGIAYISIWLKLEKA